PATTPATTQKKGHGHGEALNPSTLAIFFLVGAVLFSLIGFYAPPAFLEHFTVFVLACFVGYMVVWNVTPALHTPLMSVTNAISSIIIIGALIQVAPPLVAAIAGGEGARPDEIIRWVAVVGVALTAIAVAATLFGPRGTPAALGWIAGALAIGAGIGLYLARTVKMTQMPELVAFMHSLVGLVAMLVGYASYIDPAATAGMSPAELK